jgi:N-acetylmuramoyl-L-alanine amidase
VSRRTSGHASTLHNERGNAVPNVSRLVVVVSCLTAVGAMLCGLFGANQPTETIPVVVVPTVEATTAPLSPTGAPMLNTTPTQAPTPTTRVVPTARSTGKPKIGIVAGHWGHDTGAVCDDGLSEVEINLDVAKRVVQILRVHDYEVDLLQEFDSRLPAYRSDALVSIHADSCMEFTDATPPASGYKVARVANSMVPEQEDRLVECITNRYKARTGMFFHANSITDDMSHYHTFYEIDGQTPGAIIETGFMFADRQMLTTQTGLVAQGIAEGIICFIDGETP